MKSIRFPLVHFKFLIFTAVGFGIALLWFNAIAATQPDPHINPTLRGTPPVDRFQKDRQAPQELSPLSDIPCVGGSADIFPCMNVDLLAFMPLNEIGASGLVEGNDVWGWSDSMTGKEYAIMGLASGTSFVDISNPTAPVFLGRLPTHTFSSPWRDIKVYENHAFIVADFVGSHGMQIFDLTQLRNVVAPPTTFTEIAHYSDFNSAHNIAINEDTGYAYVLGISSGETTCGGGIHMVDIRKPTNPVFAGCFSADGHTHDSQCVLYSGPDAAHQGKEICFNANEDTLTLVDVTDKSAPIQLSKVSYQGVGYTHQGWLTEDQTYFLLGDETDEIDYGHNTRTYIWDVSDLNEPVLIDTYTAAVASIDHNLYIHEGFAYEANYTSGLRVLDVSEIPTKTLTEVGYFDIYPSSDSVTFNGSWSNYPFFESGVVIVSGIEQGLFVLKPNFIFDFEISLSPTALETCGSGGEAVAEVGLKPVPTYPGIVSLSAPGLPAGTKSNFDPNPVAVPGSSILTLTVSGSVPGNYPLQITGTDGEKTHNQLLDLTLTDIPAQPALTLPLDHALNQPLQPSFYWESVSQSTAYILEVTTDPDFAEIVYSATITLTAHTVEKLLSPETNYYWRVQAKNHCGKSEPSEVYSFRTLAAQPDFELSSNQSRVGYPGSQVVYTITLTNTGGYTDTFALSLNGDWDMNSPPPTTEPLGTGQSAFIEIRVSIPPEAPDGTEHVATLTAFSSRDETLHKSVTLTTKNQWYTLHFPAITR